MDTYKIEAAVVGKMCAGESFTSVDIANALKQDGMRIRNREVASWLRTNVLVLAQQNGLLYDVNLISVDSKRDGFTQTYLYHHMNTPASSYMDRDQNPQSWKRPHQNDVRRSVSDFTRITRTLTEALEVSKAAADEPHWKKQKRDAQGRWI